MFCAAVVISRHIARASDPAGETRRMPQETESALPAAALS